MMSIVLNVLCCVAVVFAGVLAILYARLVLAKTGIDEVWEDISNQLMRRANQIANLVSVVKEYAPHEQCLFDKLAEVRFLSVCAVASKSPQVASQSSSLLDEAMREVSVVAEQYPNLKESEAFSLVQEDLATTENNLSSMEELYNAEAQSLNRKVQTFPNRLVARFGSFLILDLFPLADESKTEDSVAS